MKYDYKKICVKFPNKKICIKISIKKFSIKTFAIEKRSNATAALPKRTSSWATCSPTSPSSPRRPRASRRAATTTSPSPCSRTCACSSRRRSTWAARPRAPAPTTKYLQVFFHIFFISFFFIFLLFYFAYFKIFFTFCEVPNYTFDVFLCPSVCLSVIFT